MTIQSPVLEAWLLPLLEAAAQRDMQLTSLITAHLSNHVTSIPLTFDLLQMASVPICAIERSIRISTVGYKVMNGEWFSQFATMTGVVFTTKPYKGWVE